jgi:hypothetical protein
MRLITLSLLAFTICAADQPSKLPATADKAYRTYVAALDRAYQAETDKVRTQLKKEMDAAMKKSDLDAAMAVKDLLAKVDGGQGLVDVREEAKREPLSDTKPANTFTVKVDASKTDNNIRARLTQGSKIKFTSVKGSWATATGAPMCDPLLGDTRFGLVSMRGAERPCMMMRLMLQIGREPAVPVELDMEYTGVGMPSLWANDSGVSDNAGVIEVTYEVVQ